MRARTAPRCGEARIRNVGTMFFGSDARVPVLPWRHSRKNLWNVLHRIPRARVGRVVRCILRLPYVTYDDYAVIWGFFFVVVQIFLLLSFPHLICAAGNIVSQSFFFMAALL